MLVLGIFNAIYKFRKTKYFRKLTKLFIYVGTDESSTQMGDVWKDPKVVLNILYRLLDLIDNKCKSF